MGTYTPHTDDEIAGMLGYLGLGSLEELFDVVPGALRLQRGLGLDPGISEPDVLAEMDELGARNRARVDRMVCFAGGGAYDHEIPEVTRALAGRSEFVTSYTPYQPEVAQGVLQAVFEFQTLVARLSGLPVSNASLYDGASATVEAVNLGVAASGSNHVWVSSGVHPHWRQVMATCAAGTGHRLVTVELVEGTSRWPDIDTSDPPGVLVVALPNYLGCLEDVAHARRICDATGALLVVAFDPVSVGIIRSPGDWGADVAVGEGQAFGTTLGFGGPYLGLFACRREHVRRLPGRLVGQTVDADGRTAYVTTLRAREQDIRREKATSNVCTNQTLMAVTAAVQLGWLGTSGMVELALRCARGTKYARDALLSVEGVEPYAAAPVVREFAVRTPVDACVVVDRMADAGFLAGIPLGSHYPDGDRGLLISVTERRTRDEIDGFVAAFAKAVVP